MMITDASDSKCCAREKGIRKLTLFEGFSDHAFAWTNVVMAIQRGTASEWFDQYPAVRGDEVFDGLLDEPHTPLREAMGHMSEWTITKPFGVYCEDASDWASLDSSYERASASSRGFERIIKALDKSGITHFASPEGEGRIIVHNLAHEFAVSNVRVYETPTGDQVEIFTHALLSDLNIAEAGPDWLVSRFLAVPAVLQACAFLAETPFPSTSGLIQFDRSLPYEDIEPQERPRPFVEVMANEEVLTLWRDGDDDVSYAYTRAATAVRLGFTVSLALRKSDLAKCLAVVADALAKVTVILEDGHVNNGEGSVAPFQSVLASRVALTGDGYRYLPYLSFARNINYSSPISETPASRFCDQCGAQTRPDAKFCASCGSRLV